MSDADLEAIEAWLAEHPPPWSDYEDREAAAYGMRDAKGDPVAGLSTYETDANWVDLPHMAAGAVHVAALLVEVRRLRAENELLAFDAKDAAARLETTRALLGDSEVDARDLRSRLERVVDGHRTMVAEREALRADLATELTAAWNDAMEANDLGITERKRIEAIRKRHGL